MSVLETLTHGRITEMSYPTRVVFGAGAIERLPAQLQRLGIARPLVVTDAGVVKAGIHARIEALLRGAGVAFHVFDAVEANPTEKTVSEGLSAYKAGNCDGFIAVGGGSPMDAGKLIQLMATHEPPISRYDDATGGDRYVKDNMKPLIAVPTTAGTGSEVGRSGVVTLQDTGRKTVIFSPYLLPKAAICDPELTVDLPRPITAATGMDAFTHGLESYVASGLHPLADALAYDCIVRVGRSLRTAYDNGKDLSARGDMMVAAMEGAMAFQKGLGACHALAHALTPISGVHHGLANAVALPTVMEFNRSVCVTRFARVAVALGESSTLDEETLSHKAIERVRKLNRDLGIPARLRDVGVEESKLGSIAEKAFQDASHQSNPRKCTQSDLFELLRAAF